MTRPMNRKHSAWTSVSALMVVCLLSAISYATPSTIVIQAKLADASGKPLSGTRFYRVQFYDAPTAGQALGAAIQTVTPISNAGRFSIEVTPPAEALAANDLYYELAIDSSSPIDNIIDANDVFPNRVRVASVMYAQKLARDGAGSGLNADLLGGLHSSDYLTTAAAAIALAGKAATSHTHNLQDLPGQITNGQVAPDLSVFHSASADLATTASYALNAGNAVNATNAAIATDALHATLADTATDAKGLS